MAGSVPRWSAKERRRQPIETILGTSWDMQDLGQRLCHLVQRAVVAAKPDESLRPIPALREGLEAFERAQVARALRRGASFGDIARALGISRQAAHRRYRDVLDDEGDAPELGREILITGEARAVVALARREASALGARKVGTEHLLLGIVRFGDPRVEAALRELGIDLRSMRANAQGTLVDGSLDGVPDGPGGISPHARAVFAQSLREAVRRRDSYIGVEHLLIATIRAGESGAHRTLQTLGVDPRQILERV
jgi:hypothetical protein